ncbi:MAG: acetyl-CoA carboxylase biotin carboxyl carrier protein subunit [Candidatus Hodarchaeota archaeon]
MKKYTIKVDGNPYILEVEYINSEALIKLNDEPFNVKITPSTPEENNLVATIGEITYQIIFKEDIALNNPFKITINEEDVNIEIEEWETPKLEPKKPSVSLQEIPVPENLMTPPTAIMGDQILAPMPGRVLKINVNVGDHIEVGDVVMIIESMKMENEIVATKPGIVKEISISEGSSVGRNDILIRLKTT